MGSIWFVIRGENLLGQMNGEIYMSDFFDWNDYEKTGFYFLEKAFNNQDDPYQLHFVYNGFIKLFFKHRNLVPDAEDKLITICKLDIELFPKFREAWFARNPDYKHLPRIPSFQRLIQVYEDRNQLDEAIRICELAIHYGLDDGTKGGFEARMKRLRKKQSQAIRYME